MMELLPICNHIHKRCLLQVFLMAMMLLVFVSQLMFVNSILGT